MSALPRGTCPACFAEVALRKGDLVREHSVGSFEATAEEVEQMTRVPVCSGSGRASVESAGRKPEIGDPVVVDGVKMRIREIGSSVWPSATLHLREHFEPHRQCVIDARTLTWDKIAGVWRVA